MAACLGVSFPKKACIYVFIRCLSLSMIWWCWWEISSEHKAEATILAAFHIWRPVFSRRQQIMAQTTQTKTNAALSSSYLCILFSCSVAKYCVYIFTEKKRSTNFITFSFTCIAGTVFSVYIATFLARLWKKCVDNADSKRSHGATYLYITLHMCVCVWKKIRENTHHNGLGEN